MILTPGMLNRRVRLTIPGNNIGIDRWAYYRAINPSGIRESNTNVFYMEYGGRLTVRYEAELVDAKEVDFLDVSNESATRLIDGYATDYKTYITYQF